MGVRFFGQFLIDQGEVDASHVREALDLMEAMNPSLGELAVKGGYMTPRQTVEVSAAQRSRDLCFGDLAVELGLLEPEQLAELVRAQRARRLPIGQALVRLGHLTSDRLGTLLDAYKTDQAQYEVGRLELPDALDRHRAAAFVIEMLPRFLMRVARMQAKVGEIRRFEGRPAFGDSRVSIALEGTGGLEMAMVSDQAFSEALAMATSGLSPRDLDPEMVADGVGEFLNVLAGNAVGAATKTGQQLELGAPDYEATVSDGWLVELAVCTGRAALVLSAS